MSVKNSNDTIGDRTCDLPGKEAGGFQIMNQTRTQIGEGVLLPASRPSPNRNLKENTGFVDVMMSVVMCDLPCSRMSHCDRLMTSAVEF